MVFRKGQTLIFGLGIPILVDALKSDKYESKINFTRNPLESGRLKTDHGQEQPDEVEFNFVITDTPSNDLEQFLQQIFQGRSKLIYNQLKLWQKLKSPILLVTGVGSFINMRIELLSASRGSRTGKSLDINIKFVELLDTDFDLAARTLLGLIDNTMIHTATESIGLGVI